MLDPKTMYCIVAVASSATKAVEKAKRAFQEKVRREGKDYVFSAQNFNVVSVGDGYEREVVVEFWLERIPRTEQKPCCCEGGPGSCCSG